FTMVRFGNVLGSSGSVVPLFKQQIASGGPVTVTHKDIIRYFMTLSEAAQLVIQAGALGQGGDVFLLDMGEPVKIDQLARRMIYLMGHKVKHDTQSRRSTLEGDASSNVGIEIVYTGLRPGEKLYEELLVGDDAQSTSHPRIMKAQESHLNWDELDLLLDAVFVACDQFDYQALRRLFLSAPLAFSPSHDVNDLLSHGYT
ncbi:MAG: polysaccharide biosynthesis protein, partial [Pseudomonadota bacterium]